MASANIAREWRLRGETLTSGITVMVFSVSIVRLLNLAVDRTYELKMIVPRLWVICKLTSAVAPQSGLLR
jgi:hypothetical protein